MRPFRFPVALAVLALSVLTNCTDDANPNAGPRNSGGGEELRVGGHRVSEFPALGDPARTLVTSPGENPQPLRYTFEAGAAQEFVIEQRQANEGQQQSAPALEVPGRGVVKRNDHNIATFELEFRLSQGQLGVPTARLTVVTDSLARSLSVQPQSGGVDPKLAPIIDALVEQLTSAVTLFPIPLPDVPIGVGGQWEVLQTVEFRGLTVHRALGCQLLEITDGGLRVKTVGVTLSPKAQRTTLPSGTVMEIVGASSKSSGEFEISLNGLLPLGSRDVEHQQTTRRVAAEGEEADEPKTHQIVESYTIRKP